MEVEMLHTTRGDKKKKLDTPEEAEAFINIQIRKGTALFLERGKKSYKIKFYDPKTDSLHVVAERHQGEERVVTARGRKSRVTGVPPVAGG